MIETRKKNLLICPTCELNGFKSILGEIGTSGDFIIQRYKEYYTIINSPAFTVICGKCGEKIFTRNEGTIPDQGTRVYFQQTTIHFGTLGTPGGTLVA